MRLHIELDDRLVAELDELSGPRGRTAFVRAAIEAALDAARRRVLLEAAAGALSHENENHDWDGDPAAWVQRQRRGDDRRAG